MSWEEAFLRATLCAFPKYAKEKLSWYDVIQKDRDYVQWLLDNVIDPDDEEELRDALSWGVSFVPDRIG